MSQARKNISTLIVENRLKEAIEALKREALNGEQEKILLMLQSRLSDLTNRKITNVISHSEEEIATNKIREGLIEIMNAIWPPVAKSPDARKISWPIILAGLSILGVLGFSIYKLSPKLVNEQSDLSESTVELDTAKALPDTFQEVIEEKPTALQVIPPKTEEPKKKIEEKPIEEKPEDVENAQIKYSTIRGRVLEAQTNKPIEGATVYSEFGDTAKTDEHGHYTLKVKNVNRRVDIRVEKEDYATVYDLAFPNDTDAIFYMNLNTPK